MQRIKNNIFIKNLIKSNFVFLKENNKKNLKFIDLKITLRQLKQFIRLLQFNYKKQNSSVLFECSNPYLNEKLKYLCNKYEINKLSLNDYINDIERKVYISDFNPKINSLLKHNILLILNINNKVKNNSIYNIINKLNNIEKLIVLLIIIKKVSILKNH